jgi:ubiquinone/menaquinone biosynthesis C-methylase UbiE
MVNSKAWNWAEVKDDIWNQPSEDVYYYVHRWKENNLSKLLDLGCGLGRNSILFAQNGFTVTAYDLSFDAIEKVNKKSRELKLSINTIIGDMIKLPFREESFDCILSYHVISHTDSEGIKKVLNEIQRVLKKNGEFYLTLCSKESNSFKSGKYKRYDENTILKDEEPEKDIPHFYANTENIKELFQNFKILKLRHIYDIFSDSIGCHYFILGKKSDKQNTSL